MIEGALLLLTLGLALAAAWGRPGLTAGILLGALLVVPATLPLPGAPTALATVSRAIEIGALIGVARAAARGALGSRGLAGHPVMLPLLAYLGVIAVTGVALADPALSRVTGAYLWVTQAEQLVFLLIGLALGRTLPARRILTMLAAAGLAGALIVVGETIVEVSWARAVFVRTAPELLGTVPASPLAERAGQLRGRGAGDFALQTGWVLAALLPAAIGACVVSARDRLATRTWLLGAAVPLLAAGVVLTRSRSPLMAVLVIAVLLAPVVVSAVGRRGPALLGLGAAAVALLVLLGPALARQLSPSVDQGSIDVRVERLPEVLSLPTGSPLRGVGLGGISQVDLPGVDTSYVLTYVETGAPAAVLLLSALLLAVFGVLRGLGPGLRVPVDAERVLVLATALGTGSLVVSAATMDTFQAQTSSRLAWLLVGLGLGAAERVRGVQVLPSSLTVLRRSGLVVVVLLAGIALSALVPGHAAARYTVATTTVTADVAGVAPGSIGRTYVVTFCSLAREVARGKDWRVTNCAEDGPPGWATLRIEGDDPDDVRAAPPQLFEAASRVRRLRDLRVGAPAEGVVPGTPTAARVAPVVLPLAVAAGVLLVPGSSRRRGDPPSQPLDDRYGDAGLRTSRPGS